MHLMATILVVLCQQKTTLSERTVPIDYKQGACLNETLQSLRQHQYSVHYPQSKSNDSSNNNDNWKRNLLLVDMAWHSASVNKFIAIATAVQ